MIRFTGVIVGYHSLLWWANDSCIWSCEIYCARTLLVPEGREHELAQQKSAAFCAARLPHMQDKAPRKPSTEAGHLFFATQHHPLTVFLFFSAGTIIVIIIIIINIYFHPVGVTRVLLFCCSALGMSRSRRRQWLGWLWLWWHPNDPGRLLSPSRWIRWMTIGWK